MTMRASAIPVLFGVVLVAVATATLVWTVRGVEGDTLKDVVAGPNHDLQIQIPTTMEELGRLLFHDGRLSGDGSTSCASCHKINPAFADGKALSDDYSRGNLYFRNTPTLINAGKMPVYNWDGRFAQGDLASVVRDHIAEAHFMNLDGRLLIERMRQVPEYEQSFIQVFGSEVSYGKVLNALVAYLGPCNPRMTTLT